MAKKTKKVSRTKTKKKIWYKILAPQTFGKKELGETYLATLDVAVGRTLKINLRDLTGSMRDQHVYVGFKITGVNGSTLVTKTIGYELTPAYVKRAVRKGTARLDNYFILETKTGQPVILKNLLVTRNRAQRSTKTDLQELARKTLKEEIEKVDFESFVNLLVSGKIQQTLKKRLAKICPVKEASVRVLKLVEKSKSGDTATKESKTVAKKAASVKEAEPEAKLVATKETEASEPAVESATA